MVTDGQDGPGRYGDTASGSKPYTSFDPAIAATMPMAYRTPSRSRSIIELAVTVIPLCLLWAATWAATAHGVWWGLLLTIPAAGFLVRLFMIQHDCGHGAFFGRRRVDDWIGRVIGVLTLTSYDCWRYTHAIHHASSGNLDARGTGDVKTLTVAEYRRLGRWRRLQWW